MPYVFISYTRTHTRIYFANLSFFLDLLLGNFRGAVFDYEPRVVVVMDYATVGSDLFCLLYIFFLLCTFCRALCNHLWPQTLKAEMGANEKKIKY